MTKTVRQVAYRLQSDGKAEVIRDAKEVGDAIRASYGQAEAGANAASSAAERQEQRYRRLAQAARDSAQADAAQARYNAAIGVDRGGAGSARESAAVFATQAAAMEDAERRARALRAIIDPLGSAQDRLNDELAEYNSLAKAGKISSAELGQAQGLARAKFDATTLSIERQGRGLSRLVVASRLNLARQGADVAVTAAMGMNPAMIAIQQGPQILDAWATSGIKVSASMVALGAAAGLVAGSLVVLGGAYYSGEAAALRMDRAVSIMGRTAGLNATQLETLARQAADSADVSIRSAEAQAAAYVSTGQIGAEIIPGLIAMSRDYAAAFGVDAKQATEDLAEAMVEPDKTARALTLSMGLLDQKSLELIDTLVKSGDKVGAQRILMEALSDAVDGQADKVAGLETAWGALGRTVSNIWHQLGDALYTSQAELESGARQAVGRLDSIIERYDSAEGQAFVAGLSPAQQAEARRQRALMGGQRDYLDRATGGDARRAQQAQATANQAAEETRIREEAAKREAEAEGRKAEAAARRARAAATRGAREAEREAREQQQRARRNEDRQSEIELESARALQDVDRVRSLNDEIALRTRIRQLVDDGASGEAARTQALSEQGQLLSARAIINERETSALFRANAIEVDRILGMTRYNREAEKAADLHERINAYVANGQLYYSAWLKAARDQLAVEEARAEVLQRIVASAEAEHRLRLAQLAGREDEVRVRDREARIERQAREIENRENLNYGEGVGRATTIVNAEIAAAAEGARRGWIKDFVSDIRRSGIGDAVAEQLERATDRMLDKLIDALMAQDWSNMFGGGGGGGTGSGGGGFGSFLSSIASAVFGSPGRNAQGTDFWSGGLTWVGERGPELLDLPRGARVTEHNRSMQLAVASASSTPVVDLGGLTIKNYGSEPMTGKMKRGSNGGLELELEPLFKGMLHRAGKDGTLSRAAASSPKPRKR